MSEASVAHEILIGHGDEGNIKEKCMTVRFNVFIGEQGFSAADEIDRYDSDPRTAHILLVLSSSGTPIGTIRCARPSDSTFKLTRLAVVKEYRSHKLGRTLVQSLHQYAVRRARLEGLTTCTIVCHSQIPAVAFYAKYGYEAEGDLFDEDGAPHQKMVARLPAEPSAGGTAFTAQQDS